jgi:Fic family protein
MGASRHRKDPAPVHVIPRLSHERPRAPCCSDACTCRQAFIDTDGRLHEPVLYLSHYFRRHRQAYYDHLQGVRDDGAWEVWLRFFLRGVVEVADEATATARRILLLREAHRNAITESLGRGAANGHRTLDALFDRPIVSVADVQGWTGTTYAAANVMVARLVEMGVLEEFTGFARNRRFRYAPYIALFQSD